MSIKIQIFIILAVVLAICYISRLVRRKQVELRYVLVWYLVGVLIMILALFPGILEWLTRLLGIALPINMLFFFGFGFVLMIIFTQTVIISNLNRKSKRLTQEVALLNKRIDDLVLDNKKQPFDGM